MFRATRPLYQVLKKTTGITGIAVHPNPLPALSALYKSTLDILQNEKIPSSSVYGQSAQAITQRKLEIVEKAVGDIAQVEKELDEGHIEQALLIATDELTLAAQMADWKAWEPLEEKPEGGQWEYAT